MNSIFLCCWISTHGLQKFVGDCPPTQTPTQKLISGFSIFSSEEIGSSLVSLEISTTWIIQIPVWKTESDNPEILVFNLVMNFLRLVVIFLSFKGQELLFYWPISKLIRRNQNFLLIFYVLKNLKIMVHNGSRSLAVVIQRLMLVTKFSFRRLEDLVFCEVVKYLIVCLF